MGFKKVLFRFFIFILLVLFVFTLSYFKKENKKFAGQILDFPRKTLSNIPYSRYGILGEPKLVSTNKIKKDKLTTLNNIGYVCCFYEEYKIPIWCSYRLSDSIFLEDYKRYPTWHSDPRVKNSVSSRDYNYKVSKKHRGHLAPSFAMNRAYGTIAMIESFYMTNATPMSEKLNSGIWADLENSIFGQEKAWANSQNEVWVICGPIVTDQNKRIGNGICLPSEYFKILIKDKNNNRFDEDQFELLAFRFPEEGAKKEAILDDFLCSVDSIEKDTDLDFFSELEDSLEERAEAVIASSTWK